MELESFTWGGGQEGAKGLGRAHELFENYINFYTWSFTFRRTKVTVQVSEKQFHGLVGSVPVLFFHKLK